MELLFIMIIVNIFCCISWLIVPYSYVYMSKYFHIPSSNDVTIRIFLELCICILQVWKLLYRGKYKVML